MPTITPATCDSVRVDADPKQFKLSAEHLAVLAHMPIPQAWRFCLRRRRDIFTPDFATFAVGVARMGVAAYADLMTSAPQPAADVEAWMLRRGLRQN